MTKVISIYPDGTRISRKIRICVGLVLALIVGILVLGGIPIGAENALFLAVTSADRSADRVFASELPGHPTGDFVVHDSKLYLKIGATRNTVIAPTASRFEWTPAKLQRFRQDHPDLEQHFPDPKMPNAGISWIRNEEI